MEETDYAPKDWHSRIYKDTVLTSTSIEANAKLRNNYDYLKKSDNIFDEA